MGFTKHRIILVSLNQILFYFARCKTSRFNYKEKDNFLQIEMENGNIKEESFYMSGDTLIIQSISNGIVKKNKFIKESLVL